MHNKLYQRNILININVYVSLNRKTLITFYSLYGFFSFIPFYEGEHMYFLKKYVFFLGNFIILWSSKDPQW